MILNCRYGFNSDGHEVVKARLREWRKKRGLKEHFKHKVVGVNLGKNLKTADAIEDYVRGVQCFGPLADYLVVNVSSPNTPGLRDMQGKERLTLLLKKVTLSCSAVRVTYIHGNVNTRSWKSVERPQKGLLC